jgi:uncharacterized membrane protein
LHRRKFHHVRVSHAFTQVLFSSRRYKFFESVRESFNCRERIRVTAICRLADCDSQCPHRFADRSVARPVKAAMIAAVETIGRGDLTAAAFFNLILLGYGLPAALAIGLALIARTTRPIFYRVGAAITAVLLALFYLTFEVRRLFHGPELAGVTSDAEQYAYSTVWLIFGIVLLAVGFLLRSQPPRLLALGVIAVTIAKVFLFDTANIAGIYRALSVTGLGVLLLGIGWLYQRVLYPRSPAPAQSG